jgi:alkylated DNA nucleotide flippase Atl1
MPTIQHLFIKSASGAPMQAVEQMRLQTAYGIINDIHAHPVSLRQLLVVRTEDLVDLGIAPGSLRENIAISGCSTDQFQPGSQISTPQGAILRLNFHCEPCKAALKYLCAPISLQQLTRKRGLLCSAIAGGILTVGDTLTIEPGRFEAFSDEPYQRFLRLIALIPTGQVLTYRQIIQSIGVTQSYCRVLPRYIYKAQQEQTQTTYPVHRIVDSNGYLLRFLDNQRELLHQEGVQEISTSGLVALVNYNWQTPNLYLL